LCLTFDDTTTGLGGAERANPRQQRVQFARHTLSPRCVKFDHVSVQLTMSRPLRSADERWVSAIEPHLTLDQIARAENLVGRGRTPIVEETKV